MAEDRSNTLGTLNDFLFQELERLNGADLGDEDAIKREVERAKAIQGIAGQITASSKIVLDTVRLRAEWAGGEGRRDPEDAQWLGGATRPSSMRGWTPAGAP